MKKYTIPCLSPELLMEEQYLHKGYLQTSSRTPGRSLSDSGFEGTFLPSFWFVGVRQSSSSLRLESGVGLRTEQTVLVFTNNLIIPYIP